MNEKEMNMVILNKLYEIARTVFAEGTNVPDGNYTASDLAKKGDNIFKEGYLQTEIKQAPEYNMAKNYYQMVEKECYVAPMANVSVLSFVCSFCVVKIFELVAKFEKLAGIPAKDKQIFVAANHIGNVIRTFEIEINKDLGKLAKFAATSNFDRELRPVLANVCLDISLHRAVATDGHTLQVRQFSVYQGSAWKESYGAFYPLVPADEWKKMCAAAGSGAKMTCKLVAKNENERFWMCECCGITSKYKEDKYPNYLTAIPNVDKTKCLQLDKKTWAAAKKWVKANNTCWDRLAIKHEENSASVKFILKDTDFGIEKTAEFPCVGTPGDYYYVCVKASTLVKTADEFNLYLPEYAERALTYISDRVITLQMPLLALDEDNYFLRHTNKSDAFYLANFHTEEQINILDERTQSIESAKVDNNTIEQTNEPESATNEPAKEQALVSVKSGRKVALDADAKKFAFAKVGIKPGDVLTFIDGTEVIAAENNTVEFLGEKFTLSGFCKEFMPEKKRSKSNSYRGCAYFFLNGVKLEKLFKEYQKAQAVTLEDQAEEVASVSNDTLDNTAEQTDDRPRWERRFDDVWANESESLQVVVKAQIKYYLSNSIYVLDDDGAIYHLQVSRYNVCEDTFTIRDAEEPDTVLYVGADRQLFAAWYHAHEITEGRYLAIKNNDPSLKEVCKEQYEDPLDGVPNELPATTEKAEPTITPGAKVIALNATETTSGAKPIMLDVGTMAKVVHISLGVPPECTEAVSGALSVASGPPNIHGVRPAVAAAGLNNAAVGYCLGVVGKVVHTLPLPPPGRKRISELTTYTNYCNTS